MERYKYYQCIGCIAESGARNTRKASDNMAKRDIKELTDAELGTELMSVKNAIGKLEDRVRELVDEAESRGLAGTDIPTVGGDYVVSLSSGTQRKYNEDKAIEVLGAEVVASVYDMKRRKVKLALSDFGTSIDNKTKDLISDLVEATIKAEVKKKK